MICHEPIRRSGSHFCFGVETLNKAVGKLSFGPKTVQKQRSVSAQLNCHLLHWLNLQKHGFGTPLTQKATPPVGRVARPQLLELLLQKTALHRFQVLAQQIRKFWCLFLRQVLWPLQQQAGFTLHWLLTVTLEMQSFRSAHRDNGLAQARHHIKPVEQLNRSLHLPAKNPYQSCMLNRWRPLPVFVASCSLIYLNTHWKNIL